MSYKQFANLFFILNSSFFILVIFAEQFSGVNTITKYYNLAAEAYGVWGLVLMALILVLFGVQLRYYLGLFRRLPAFKVNSQKDRTARPNGISVVLVLGDDYLYVENTLPRLLHQDYELYEVIAVYVGNNNDFAEMLEVLAGTEPNFGMSRIKQHPLFPISNKMALNVGIKAARYDNIVITTPDSHPVYYGLNDFSQLRLDQVEFLREELSGENFLEAGKKVLVHHIPVYGLPEEYNPCLELWHPVLEEAPFDVAVNGHTHRKAYHPAGSVEGNNFPVVVGGGSSIGSGTVIILDRKGDELRLKMLSTGGDTIYDIGL